MEEPASGALVVDVVEEALPGVAKGRVTDVVTQRDSLDEVEVEAQRTPDVACDASHELHVQAAAAEVVVGAEREHLRLAAHAVVRGQVHDLLGVTYEGWAQGRVGITLAAKPA